MDSSYEVVIIYKSTTWMVQRSELLSLCTFPIRYSWNWERKRLLLSSS